MKIGNRISQAIKEIGLNQTTFAKKLKLTQPTINSWITGRRNPTVTTLKKISKAIGVPLNYFLNDSISNVKNNKGIVGHNSNIVGQVSINTSKDVELLQKENELLKRELEIERKEKKLSKKSK
jgi:transcriptional regulator with XRE-family HTH domain